MARWVGRRGAAWSIGLLAAVFVLSMVLIPRAAASVGANVRVGRVLRLSAIRAYQRLHQSGLRISFAAVQLAYFTDPPVHVVAQSPAAGQAVSPSTVVHLKFGCPGCGAGSPSVPRHMPTYLVPRFIGQKLAAAWQWVRHKQLYFIAYLGKLTAGNAPSLFDNYRVIRQKPPAGTRLKLGKARRCCHGNGGSFKPTPLTVWTTQTASQ